MLKQSKIEAVIEELARQQGHELNGQEQLIIRTRINSALSAKERYRQQMNSGVFQWQRKTPPRG